MSNLTRYEDTAPVDYMVKSATGEWVPASEALELEARIAAAVIWLVTVRADHPAGVIAERAMLALKALRVDQRLPAAPSLACQGFGNAKDCGGAIGAVTWCCEKHAAEDGEGLVKQREQAVLDAMAALQIDPLRTGEDNLAYVLSPREIGKAIDAELRRRGLK